MKNNPLDIITVTSSFGMRIHPITKKNSMHYGIDLRGNKGTKVYAVDDGVVAVSKYNSISGEYVTIKHNGYYSFYCHLSKRYFLEGQKVKAGDIIGEVGSTGSSTAPHLHFGLCSNYVASAINQSRWFNPMPYIEEVMMKLVNLPITMNGKKVKIQAIEYNNENYVRLRSLADADTSDKVEVSWNKKNGVIVNTK